MWRVVIPDSHGERCDQTAIVAAVNVVKKIKPTEIVLLGDHVNFEKYSHWPQKYPQDFEVNHDRDIREAHDFMVAIRSAAPRASIHYLEGNHEQRMVIKLATAMGGDYALLKQHPVDEVLGLSKLRIKYYERLKTTKGMCVPGVLQLEACAFLHGSGAGLHETYNCLRRFNRNVVHGHCHRATHVVQRLPDGETIHGMCPGTLSRLQETYQHSNVSQWSHGVVVQHIDRAGTLWPFLIPIKDGEFVLPS